MKPWQNPKLFNYGWYKEATSLIPGMPCGSGIKGIKPMLKTEIVVHKDIEYKMIRMTDLPNFVLLEKGWETMADGPFKGDWIKAIDNKIPKKWRPV